MTVNLHRTITPAADGLVWQMTDLTDSGTCDGASWCQASEGKACPPPEGNNDRALHGRDVAIGRQNNRIVMVVAVTQWRALRPWRDSGTAFYPNTDQEPQVNAYFYESPHAFVWDIEEAQALVEVLQLTGCGPLARVLAAAVDLATQVAAPMREGR